VAQKPEVDGLIEDVEEAQGAIIWVSQIFDVDFSSAVSFLKPFEGRIVGLAAKAGSETV
jgi:hypothetical protein